MEFLVALTAAATWSEPSLPEPMPVQVLPGSFDQAALPAEPCRNLVKF
jgi:hypothetical protein